MDPAMVQAADLFGTPVSASQVRGRLYADEIKEYTNRLGHHWMYIGVLAIPDRNVGKALQYLEDDREAGGYAEEIHFSELKNRAGRANGEKTEVARRWVERVLWDHEKIFHFYLLGLNMTNLELSKFGPRWEQDRNIYNRFFRSATAYALKAFFGSHTPITVSQIFHDNSEMRADSLFDWHTIWRLSSSEEDITFSTDTIHFIDSDHKKEPDFPHDSHLVQLTDILAGGISQCLDARNTKSGCCEVAECLLPLVERLTDLKQASNPNSRFRHLRRISVSFFPKKRLSLRQLEDPVERARSGFYKERRPLFKDREGGQLLLF
jgi:hypothetical protein